MKLVVGLGNPGKEYDKTRHNIGFMVLDDYLGNVKWSNKFNALYYESVINQEKVLFICCFCRAADNSLRKRQPKGFTCSCIFASVVDISQIQTKQKYVRFY